MVQANTDTHVQQKQDGEASYRLEISGVEGVVHRGKSEQKENSGSRADRSFVEHRNIDAFDGFAEIYRLLFFLCHGPNYTPWGID